MSVSTIRSKSQSYSLGQLSGFGVWGISGFMFQGVLCRVFKRCALAPHFDPEFSGRCVMPWTHHPPGPVFVADPVPVVGLTDFNRFLGGEFRHTISTLPVPTLRSLQS